MCLRCRRDLRIVGRTVPLDLVRPAPSTANRSTRLRRSATPPGSPAQQRNLRGNAHHSFDCAGLVVANRFDFKGNLLEASRRLSVAFQTESDWRPSDSATGPTPADILASVNGLLETQRAAAYLRASGANPVEGSQSQPRIAAQRVGTSHLRAARLEWGAVRRRPSEHR